ncbi:hypothetical protein HWB05_gp022 [Streptomyces phage BRock]|uniref:Uncharacterized protein n=1 Tax=Streptomyces phage BRock TaxID=1913591 RepID=A0A1J0GVT3_9CAUD|nr:hypothetical protein HWB05_gp022 [Streptomyces phage BRock]APC46284.1 hypothetical protein [Streptomyces phage BRock]
MHAPAYKNFSEFPQTIAGFTAWQQQCAEWAEYRQWVAKRRFHARPEEKGIPVAHTGKTLRRKSVNGHGVSAGSRVLSHWYRDETWESKGQTRRAVRRIETRMWVGEWTEELTHDTDGSDAREWFATQSTTERLDRNYWYEGETLADRFERIDYEGNADMFPPVYTVGVTELDESYWDQEDDYGYSYGCDRYCEICYPDMRGWTY